MFIKPKKKGLISKRSLIIGTPALFVSSRLSALSNAQICLAAPGPAKDAGFTDLVFYDDFLTPKTIDINGTGAPGYNWYTKHFTGPDIPIPINPTPASWLRVQDSILTILTSVNPGFNGFELASTCFYGGTSVANGFQLTPGNGAYFQVNCAFNPALAPGSATPPTGWPTPLWMQSTAGHLAQVNGTSLAHYVEYDVLEVIPTSAAGAPVYSFGAHDWTSVGATYTSNTVETFGRMSPGTGFHTWEMLWQTIAGGGGANGLVQRFYDGTYLGPPYDMTYSTSAGSAPAATPSNPNGSFSSGDSEIFTLFMLTGQNWPLQIDWLAVWQ
jgi:hypothetical protein